MMAEINVSTATLSDTDRWFNIGIDQLVGVGVRENKHLFED